MSIVIYFLVAVCCFAAGLLFGRKKDTQELLWKTLPKFMFYLSDYQVAMNFQQLKLRNASKSPAENVEITHRSAPDAFEIIPSTKFTEEKNEAGEHIITIPFMAPGEELMLSLITYKTAILPELLTVRCRNHVSKQEEK